MRIELCDLIVQFTPSLQEDSWDWLVESEEGFTVKST
jgi:hypothetical protein